MDWFHQKIKQIQVDPQRAINSIGTLGGGNHFLEVGESNLGGYWVTIHSGSRKFGENICRYHQIVAKKTLEHNRNNILQLAINQIMFENKNDQTKIQSEIDRVKKNLGLNFDIDIKGLEFLSGTEAMDYLFDMIFAQQYARVSRKTMGEIIMNNVFKGQTISDKIDSVHNYIDFNDLIIRKGAIQSYTGVRSVIPFNMEDGLLIVEGKSNPEWNFSAPHGAGRLMSRTKAKEVLSLEDMKNGMESAGVYSTSINKHTLDEAKGAYKSSEIIELAIEPTATIIERVKPILNIKDCSNDMSWKERRNEKKKREELRGKEKNDIAYRKMKKIK
jgi:RNA-splicing ligase RtcB